MRPHEVVRCAQSFFNLSLTNTSTPNLIKQLRAMMEQRAMTTFLNTQDMHSLTALQRITIGMTSGGHKTADTAQHMKIPKIAPRKSIRRIPLTVVRRSIETLSAQRNIPLSFRPKQKPSRMTRERASYTKVLLISALSVTLFTAPFEALDIGLSQLTFILNR